MRFLKLKSWWQLMILAILAVALFCPLFGNSFVNDDFIVIKRVCIDKQFFVPGFFRPLSDLTLLLTYQLFGLHPFFYYLTGILLHAVATWLLMQLCVRWKWTADEGVRSGVALAAGALFFVYPFHNETVAWILGRGASMAGILALGAMIAMTTGIRESRRKLLVCLCYFLGLMAYETILVLPLLVLFYLAGQGASYRSMLVWMLGFSVVLVFHLGLRVYFSGQVVGDYGGAFLQYGPAGWTGNLFKAMGRTMLPPTDRSRWLQLAFVVVLAAWGGSIYLFNKRFSGDLKALSFLRLLVIFYGICLILPAFAGVSTHTSEGDRLLQLPSFFLCMMGALLLVQLVRRKRLQIVMLAVALFVSVWLLEQNNLRWRLASSAVKEVIGLVKKNEGKTVYVANLPEEIDGAFVFRVGFTEALLINGIDTGRVKVLSRLKRGQDPAGPTAAGWREAIIGSRQTSADSGAPGPAHPEKGNEVVVLYWNGRQWSGPAR